MENTLLDFRKYAMVLVPGFNFVFARDHSKGKGLEDKIASYAAATLGTALQLGVYYVGICHTLEHYVA